jgi:hypothetical protein
VKTTENTGDFASESKPLKILVSPVRFRLCPRDKTRVNNGENPYSAGFFLRLKRALIRIKNAYKTLTYGQAHYVLHYVFHYGVGVAGEGLGHA